LANLLDTLKTKIRIWLSIPETENTFLVGTTSLYSTDRDRPAYTREEILEQCLDAWRYNPLARRIVELTTQYTIGTGFEISAQDEKVEQFILEFWNHRLNEMDTRLAGFSDELARTGNLFLLISTDPSGMSYIRAVPTDQVEEIITAKNDLDQEIAYRLKNKWSEDDTEETTIPAYTSDPILSCGALFESRDPASVRGNLCEEPGNLRSCRSPVPGLRSISHCAASLADCEERSSLSGCHFEERSSLSGCHCEERSSLDFESGRVRSDLERTINLSAPDDSGSFPPVMVHYAVNRPVGALWGEPDLSHLLKWLGRYTAWLEDRVRLNRFRNAFLYVVKASYVSEAARKARQAELAANPPTPGSILVTDESEVWSVMTPKLEALDANTDGLSIKKMIAAGAGVPLHFLAEPEHSTKTTAESAGEPTYRKFEMRQQVLVNITRNLLQIVLARRAEIDRNLDRAAVIEVHAADISARDNSALASAGSAIKNTALDLLDRGMIDSDEALRLIYKYLSEQRVTNDQ